MEWIIYIIIGLLAGFLAGLFGIGGGLIIIPMLSYALLMQGVEQGLIMHIAVATSLAVIFFTSISAVIAQTRYSAIDWRIFTWMSFGLCFGSFIGAIAASLVSGQILQFVIGLFSLTIALQLFLTTLPVFQQVNHNSPKKIAGIIFTAGGVFIGLASAIFGIGGGSLTVPYLTWCRVPMKTAVGTSSACALPISLVSSIGYIIMSRGITMLPSGSVGYIYFPALVPIAVFSVVCARFGVNVAHRLSSKLLKRAFALLLLVIGLTFLFK